MNTLRRINWGLIVVVLACLLFWALVGWATANAVASRATAQAVQYPALNAVASAVAGHPVVASCATSTHEWASFEDKAGYTFEVDGFTFIGRESVIYLAPRICDTLMADLTEGPASVGPFWLGLAIKVILHESTHQAGVVDEGATDCLALSLVKSYAVSTFKVAATITKVVYTKTASGLYRRTVHTVPNPLLASIYASALRWHRLLPAEYQGGC